MTYWNCLYKCLFVFHPQLPLRADLNWDGGENQRKLLKRADVSSGTRFVTNEQCAGSAQRRTDVMNKHVGVRAV
jgi:hypothetical protein